MKLRRLLGDLFGVLALIREKRGLSFDLLAANRLLMEALGYVNLKNIISPSFLKLVLIYRLNLMLYEYRTLSRGARLLLFGNL